MGNSNVMYITNLRKELPVYLLWIWEILFKVSVASVRKISSI